MSSIGPSFAPQFGSKATHNRTPQFGSGEQYMQYPYAPYAEQNPYTPPKKSGGIFSKLFAGALAVGSAIIGFKFLKNTEFGKNLLTKAGELPVIGGAVKYVQESSLFKAIPKTFGDLKDYAVKAKDWVFGLFKGSEKKVEEVVTEAVK